MENKGFSIGQAFRIGWKTFTENCLFLVGIIFLIFFLTTGPALLSINYPDFVPIRGMGILSAILSIIISIASFYVALSLVKGNKPTWKGFFEKLNLFFSFFFCSIVYALIVTVGLALFIVPGIYWGIRYLFWPYLIIDQKMGPFEALKASAKQSYGIKWDLLGMSILALLINLLGTIVFLIGLLFTAPITMLAWAWVYLQTKQSHDTIENTPS